MMAPLLRRGAMFPAMGNHEHEEPHEMVEMVQRYWGGQRFDGTDLYFDFQSGGIWFLSIDTELDFGPDSEQMKWLVGWLDAVSKLPGYRFSVVYQHRPMWTCGESDDHPDEQAYFAPYFKKYKVLARSTARRQRRGWTASKAASAGCSITARSPASRSATAAATVSSPARSRDRARLIWHAREGRGSVRADASADPRRLPSGRTGDATCTRDSKTVP